MITMKRNIYERKIFTSEVEITPILDIVQTRNISDSFFLGPYGPLINEGLWRIDFCFHGSTEVNYPNTHFYIFSKNLSESVVVLFSSIKRYSDFSMGNSIQLSITRYFSEPVHIFTSIGFANGVTASVIKNLVPGEMTLNLIRLGN